MLYFLYESLLNYWFFQDIVFGHHILDYIISIVLFFGVIIFCKPVIRLLLSVLKKTVNKTKNTKDDKIISYFEVKIGKSFLLSRLIFGLYFAIIWLFRDDSQIQIIADKALLILCSLFIASIFVDFISYVITKQFANKNDGKSNSLYLLLPVIKVFIWVLAIFFVVSNLGYNISGLLATLGIGGIALALASQSFLGDLLSFVSIVSDKPFEIGDYISVNDLIEGTVKTIGFKSVRIERNYGEEVSFPNSKITSSELHNYSRMQKRRGDLILKIDIKTSNEKLQLITDIVKDICKKNDKLEFVRCHFSDFVDFSYEVTIMYFVLDLDYMVFADTREYLNYSIKQRLADECISIACPTYKVDNNEKE